MENYRVKRFLNKSFFFQVYFKISNQLMSQFAIFFRDIYHKVW